MMNKYFENIIADLDLLRDSETLSDTSTSVSSILENFIVIKVFWKFRKPLIRLIIFLFMS